MKGGGWKDLIKLNLITAFGMTVIANVAVAGFIGYWLDRITFKNNVLFVIFLFLGVFSGLFNGIRQLLKEAEKYEKIDKKDDKGDDNSDDN